MPASLGEDGTFDFAKDRRKAAMPKLAPPFYAWPRLFRNDLGAHERIRQDR